MEEGWEVSPRASRENLDLATCHYPLVHSLPRAHPALPSLLPHPVWIWGCLYC